MIAIPKEGAVSILRQEPVYRSCRCVGGPLDRLRVARKDLPPVIPMRDDQGVYVLACSEADGSVFVYQWDAS